MGGRDGKVRGAAIRAYNMVGSHRTEREKLNIKTPFSSTFA
jgi:hypothetical protein